MKHKDKVKLFRKMSLTKREREEGVSLFNSEEWERRKKSKKSKTKNYGTKHKH